MAFRSVALVDQTLCVRRGKTDYEAPGDEEMDDALRKESAEEYPGTDFHHPGLVPDK